MNFSLFCMTRVTIYSFKITTPQIINKRTYTSNYIQHFSKLYLDTCTMKHSIMYKKKYAILNRVSYKYHEKIIQNYVELFVLKLLTQNYTNVAL